MALQQRRSAGARVGEQTVGALRPQGVQAELPEPAKAGQPAPKPLVPAYTRGGR